MKKRQLKTKLPYKEKTYQWSKEIIREKLHFASGSELLQYVVHMDNYAVSAMMMAMYDFDKDPLEGKYKAVIFDQNHGIVLSTRNTRQIIGDFLNNEIFEYQLGLAVQKKIARSMNLNRYHALSFNKFAFFSLKGFTNGKTSWLNLSALTEFSLHRRNASFTSVEVNGSQHIFCFDKVVANLDKVLSEAITHNLVVKRGLLAYESKLMGRPVVSGREKKSLLNDSQYFAYEIMPKCDANYLVSMSKGIWHDIFLLFGKRLFKLLEINWNYEDYKEAYKHNNRINYLR
ncbi:MAG: hypothetical protein N4Q77_05905 [Lactobacillus iners]|nr:hypothetical protein [Lactobacillus iners]